METIGAFDAKTRWSELLDRAAKGEAFEITKHGHPVARIVPVNGPDRSRAAAAVARLRSMRGTIKGVTKEEMIATIDEGRRF